MSILTIVQNVADSVGFNRPTSVVGSADEIARQLLQLIKIETRALSDEFPWQRLRKRASFNLVSGTESYALATVASDFKDFIQGTIWNTTTKRPVIAPLNAQDYEIQKNYLVTSGIDKMIYVYGDALKVLPVPSSTDTIVFEHTTLNIFQTSGGVGKAAVTLDTDSTVLPEYLIELGTIFRYQEAKGFIPQPIEASHEYKDYRRQVDKAIEKDGFGRKNPISLTGSGDAYWMGAYTQDSNFPSV